MLTNQGLRGLFRERSWKGVFPMPVDPVSGFFVIFTERY